MREEGKCGTCVMHSDLQTQESRVTFFFFFGLLLIWDMHKLNNIHEAMARI